MRVPVARKRGAETAESIHEPLRARDILSPPSSAR